LRRSRLSRPIQTALTDSLITDGSSVFDFGCGHGDDVRLLSGLGIPASGWDPAFFPHNVPPSSADVVNLGYVINVKKACSEADALLFILVSARLHGSHQLHEQFRSLTGRPLRDPRSVTTRPKQQGNAR
jgi:DNA phosphorothioation-associated putative methyltransferase